MEVSDYNYSLISSPYDSFMRKHLQHYGYFCGRGETVKKYGFLPSKSQISSSSSDSGSSCSDDENETYCYDESDLLLNRSNITVRSAECKSKTSAADSRTIVRQGRIPFGSNLRSGAYDESSFEPRWPIEVEVLSEPRIKHLDLSPNHPELFYKPTTDYGPYVRSFDENNSRTVFNYNPESCGYFIRSRIGGNREGCRQAAVTLRDADDTTLIFESRFESGNLMKAVQVGEFEYELYLRYDLYTKRNTQWFYFRMQNIRANRRYRFTIVNFFKPTSLYSSGMMPLMYSSIDAETKNIGWRRWGEEIVYYRNNLTAPDGSTNMYSLTWTCKFSNDNDTCYFAHCYPYTYSDLQDYLNEIQNDRVKSQYCKQKILCRTLAGNFIYMLTITNPSTTNGASSNPAFSAEHQVKKGVVITARVHPGETNASWMMKGLLDFLLGHSADARVLRDNFIFKVIPMLNPDGVIVGNYRCSLSGRDLNRNYKTILKDAYPSIWHTREMIKRFVNEIDVVLYCDFHGHSRKQNVFVYGCENRHLPNERMKERIFPAMLAKNDPSKFSYYSCRFKVQKHKEGTGRVVMWSLGIRNSYTLEATFCGSTQQDRAGHHFNTKDLESIGYHFLDSLLDYCDPDQTKRNRILNEIENDFRHSIQMKLLSRGVNPAALNDIDFDQFSSDDESSDDAGSDSSVDDGLPKHLEIIAATNMRMKQVRNKTAVKKPGKDLKKKDETDKENLEKSKSMNLPIGKGRNAQFPTIDLLETTFLTTNNDEISSVKTELEQRRHRRRRRAGDENYRLCKCFACLNAQMTREEMLLVNDLTRSNRMISARRVLDPSTDSVRYEGSNGMNNRANRWPTLATTQINNGRSNPGDDKARRSQANYTKVLARDATFDDRDKPQQLLCDDDALLSSSYFPTQTQSSREIRAKEDYSVADQSFTSCQPSDLTALTTLNEPRETFTATYLLRRLNILERESAPGSTIVPTLAYPNTATPTRYNDDANGQVVTDNENENEFNRSLLTNVNDDERPSTSSYVTNRLSAHLNERLLGIPRPSTRPKSTSNAAPNRTILDIRSIQPTIQVPNQKRIAEQQQHQRQRVMMVFGKQGSTTDLTEKNSTIAGRSFRVTINERKTDDSTIVQENPLSPSTISKLSPLQPENIPINILSRYDSTTLNRPLIVRASSVKKSTK